MTLAPFRATADWTVKTIAPSGSWNGTTSWGGRTAPTESASLYGSGFSQKAIGVLDTPPYLWYTADTHIGVAVDHGDSSWIDYVEFWCEGSTTRVYACGMNPDTGVIGYFVKLQPPAGTDGDCDIYARIVPVNGYERLVGPLRCILNKGGSITRTVKTVKTSGGDYTTIRAAANAAADGWIIKVDPGTWTDDTDGSAGSALTRGFEIRPADGYGIGDVVIARSTRTWWLGCARNICVYRNIKWSTDNISVFEGSTNAVRVMIGCQFIDPNGILPIPGYMNTGVGAVTTFFRIAEGQTAYCIDCTFRQPHTAGWKLARNCFLGFSGDSWTIQNLSNNASDILCSNTVAQFAGPYAGRWHTPSTLTVASASYNAGTGRTTITLSGSPTINTLLSSDLSTDDKMWVLTGSLAGQHFALYSQDDTTDTVVVTGNAGSLVAGDTFWTGSEYHNDTMQFFGTGGTFTYENVIAQRYRTLGSEYQPMLLQTNSTSTIKDVAIQLCIFDWVSGTSSQSQWQNGLEHVVMRQSTHLGTPLTLVTDSPGWSASDVLVTGCVLGSLNPGGVSIPDGCTVSNCHFVTGSSYSTSGATTGSAGLGSDYRPTAGSAVLAGTTTRLPFDYYGNRWTGTVAKGACKEVS